MSTTPHDAATLWSNAEREQRVRAAAMPNVTDALERINSAYYRLIDMGWKSIIYCPKDGTVFEAIIAGPTKTFDCYYSGDWPHGHWFIYDAGDIWPAHPILWRPKQEESKG